jgi:hypothetical protein
MCEPLRLTILWDSTACYRDDFTFIHYSGFSKADMIDSEVTRIGNRSEIIINVKEKELNQLLTFLIFRSPEFVWGKETPLCFCFHRALSCFFLLFQTAAQHASCRHCAHHVILNGLGTHGTRITREGKLPPTEVIKKRWTRSRNILNLK